MLSASYANAFILLFLKIHGVWLMTSLIVGSEDDSW